MFASRGWNSSPPDRGAEGRSTYLRCHLPDGHYKQSILIATKEGSVYGWTFKLHDDGKTYLLVGPNNDMSNPSYFRHVN